MLLSNTHAIRFSTYAKVFKTASIRGSMDPWVTDMLLHDDNLTRSPSIQQKLKGRESLQDNDIHLADVLLGLEEAALDAYANLMTYFDNLIAGISDTESELLTERGEMAKSIHTLSKLYKHNKSLSDNTLATILVPTNIPSGNDLKKFSSILQMYFESLADVSLDKLVSKLKETSSSSAKEAFESNESTNQDPSVSDVTSSEEQTDMFDSIAALSGIEKHAAEYASIGIALSRDTDSGYPEFSPIEVHRADQISYKDLNTETSINEGVECVFSLKGILGKSEHTFQHVLPKQIANIKNYLREDTTAAQVNSEATSMIPSITNYINNVVGAYRAGFSAFQYLVSLGICAASFKATAHEATLARKALEKESNPLSTTKTNHESTTSTQP